MLPAYGHELASAFNQFYHMCRCSGQETQDARLSLVEATMWALRARWGMSAPEEM